MGYFVVTVEVDPEKGAYVQVLVEYDESFNVVNELGLENLVVVRASALDSNTTNTTTTTANPNGDVTPQLGLTTEVSKPTSEVNVYILAESEDEDLDTTKEWLEPHVKDLANNFSETAKLDTFTFAVVKSSGDTRSLEVIEDEQEQAANSQQTAEAKFDPILVYGIVGVCSAFALIGVGACIAVVIVSRRNNDNKTQKIRVAPANKQQVPDPENFVFTRASSPDKIKAGNYPKHGAT